MRLPILTSFTAILITIAAVAGLETAGMAPHLHAALLALGATLIASVLAGVPLMLIDRSSPMATAQASLGATIIHLFVMVAAGGIVILGKITVDIAFVYWLATLYFATLVALVTSIILTVRSVPTERKI
jgi:hypothetical protein